MQGDAPVSWLMFFTLIAGLVVITGSFLYFLRHQRNRDIAANALAGDKPMVGATTHGAWSDLAGVGIFAVVVMGLLALGVSHRSGSAVADASSSRTTGMAQPAGLADQPKQYQPANPAPDVRTAPAASSTGVGSDNGGRPETTTK